VLLRHGQSTANAAGLFTGLQDVSLTTAGIIEAAAAARLLNAARLWPDLWLTSPLLRARQTLEVVERDAQRPPAEIRDDWRLSERNYGALTGLSKAEVLAEYGPAQFLSWRRSVDDAPPPMTETERDTLPVAVAHPELGFTESLRDVIARVGDCYQELIVPTLLHGGSVLVIAHGNSLRALCAIIDRLDDDETRELNLPTGQPLVYDISADGSPAIRGGRYLDPINAKAGAFAIAHEGGT
jgi:2,3-bisphosphoglycerate-dependent phosphoglycerate mutase